MSHQPSFFEPVPDRVVLETPHQDTAFHGPAYEPQHDFVRLTGQILRVYACMSDGQWRTLSEIAAITHDPEASVSAQLRHLRKLRYGSHDVQRRPRGDRDRGLWEYRLATTESVCNADRTGV